MNAEDAHGLTGNLPLSASIISFPPFCTGLSSKATMSLISSRAGEEHGLC